MARATLYPMMMGGASREALGMPAYSAGPRERRTRGLYEGLTALGAGLLAGGAPRVGAPAGASAFAPGLMAFQEALERDRARGIAAREQALQERLGAAQIANLESQAAAREAETAFKAGVVARYAPPGDVSVRATAPAEPAGSTFEVAPGVTAELLPPPPETPPGPGEARPVGQRKRMLSPDQKSQLAQLAATDPAAALKQEIEWTQPAEVKLSDVKGIRDSYRADSATWNDMSASYRRIRTALNSPTGPSDVGLLFNFMKMVDPGSVVREGEFLTIKRASALPEWIKGYVDQLNKGTILTPTQRAQLVKAADDYYGEAADKHAQRRTDYETLAQREGIDPGRVVFDTFRRAPPLRPETLQQGGFAENPAAVVINHPMASRPVPQTALRRLRADPSPEAIREFNEMFAQGGMDLASLFLRDM